MDLRSASAVRLPRFDAIVLAGGRAQRLGGVDKPGLVLGGRPLIERVLHAVATAERRVVVGPPRSLPPDVVVCQEEPSGTGPLAALAAGLPLTRQVVVVVLAADLPRVAPAVPLLRAALAPEAGSRPDGAMLVDATGQLNMLAAAWWRASLVRALRELGDPAMRPMRSLSDHATVVAVRDLAEWGADCDTPDDVARAERRLSEGSDVP